MILRAIGKLRRVPASRSSSNLGGWKPLGEPLAQKYDSASVEAGWSDEWQRRGCARGADKKFRMVLPPPNITGDLHLGHALTVAIEDSVCRYKRLRGFDISWTPGFDHAGIATQAVLERKISKEFADREFNREERLDIAARWKKEKTANIRAQLTKLGASLNWNESLYTLDPRMNRAVGDAFVELYRKGKIYRDTRLVNWSPKLRSTISDVEVDMVPVGPDQKIDGVNMGCLHDLAFPIVGGGEIIVSTGRPETTFADVAIAVNPSDERYAHLEHKGVHLEHPITGRKLILVKDPMIDKTQGTGAMKVTPAYAKPDFDLCRKHGLGDHIECLDEDGLLTVEGFRGDRRDKATKKVLKMFEELGLYRGKRSVSRTVPVCSRTGALVDMRLKDQWFMKCGEAGERALEAITEGVVRILPAYQENVLREWLRKNEDWCLSRQLWWGHQIPAFEMPDGRWIVSNDPDRDPAESRRDPDVLDTWFSSGLYPLVAGGWPSVPKPAILDLMETGHDILFFWVFRMMVLSLELCDQVPFSRVFLHGLLRDAQGRKMSKSLGNAIDPNHIIDGASLQTLQEGASKLHASGYLSEKELKAARALTQKMFPRGLAACGADALRFSILKQDVSVQDIRFNPDDSLKARNFCNKIWQGVRFQLAARESDKMDDIHTSIAVNELDLVDRWILNRLTAMEKIAADSYESIDSIHNVPHGIEFFWLKSFCDVYLEYIKPDIREKSDSAGRRLAICSYITDSFLRMASPVMPFLTEELFHRIQMARGLTREECESIHTQQWPVTDQWETDCVEERMESILKIVSEARIAKKNGQPLESIGRFDSETEKIVRILARI